MLHTVQKQIQAKENCISLHNIPEKRTEKKPKKPPCGYIYEFLLDENLNVVRKAKNVQKKKIGKYENI